VFSQRRCWTWKSRQCCQWPPNLIAQRYKKWKYFCLSFLLPSKYTNSPTCSALCLIIVKPLLDIRVTRYVVSRLCNQNCDLACGEIPFPISCLLVNTKTFLRIIDHHILFHHHALNNRCRCCRNYCFSTLTSANWRIFDMFVWDNVASKCMTKTVSKLSKIISCFFHFLLGLEFMCFPYRLCRWEAIQRYAGIF